MILGEDWSLYYSQKITMTLAEIPADFTWEGKIQLDLKSEDKLNPKQVRKTKIFFHVIGMENNLVLCNEKSSNQYKPESTAQIYTKQNHGCANRSIISSKTK